MILKYRIFGDIPFNNLDTSLVTTRDYPIFIFVAFLLIFVFVKSKWQKNKSRLGEELCLMNDSNGFNIKSFDVLTQPKIDYRIYKPHQRLSINDTKYKTRLIVLGVIAFYFWFFCQVM